MKKMIRTFVLLVSAITLPILAASSYDDSDTTEYLELYDIKLPLDAADVTITYNTVIISSTKSAIKSGGKFESNKSLGANLLEAQGPGYPGTPKNGDLATYTYTSGGYKYTVKYKYECNKSTGSCGWILDKKTVERITESIK